MSSRSPSRLLFIAPLPPPLHGQSFASQVLLGRLPAHDVRALSVSGGPAAKLVRHLQAMLALVAGPGGGTYISVNANTGMWLTVLMAAAARLRGRRIVLHHHTSDHLNRTLARMRALAFAAGEAAHHVVMCDFMAAALDRRYGISPANISLVSNVIFVDRLLLELDRPALAAGRLTVGHLSNLTMEKGLGRVIAAFRALRRAGLSDRLMIAGPPADGRSADALARAKAEFGDELVIWGAVGGERKLDFFRQIDLFLFPSLYKNEAQGIVNLEALAAGVPVAAFAVCCVEDDLKWPSGVAVDPSSEFTDAAITFARHIVASGRQSSAAARAHFLDLLTSHEGDLDALLDRIRPQTPRRRTQRPGGPPGVELAEL